MRNYDLAKQHMAQSQQTAHAHRLTKGRANSPSKPFGTRLFSLLRKAESTIEMDSVPSQTMVTTQ